VPIRLVEMAVKKAMVAASGGKPFPEFTYMCGIVWNKINDGSIDYSVTAETAKVFTYFEANEMECAAWGLGFDAGFVAGRGPAYRVSEEKERVEF
jgi:hypothetical protein